MGILEIKIHTLSGALIAECSELQTPDNVPSCLPHEGSWQPLTLSPPNKLSSPKFLVCFNFQSASMSLKVGENII